MQSAFTKAFRIGPADRTAPNPAQWKITAPPAGTRDPLVLDFGEPMDQALALRLITVAAETPAALEGNATLSQAERQWSFTPTARWPAGNYRVVIAPEIEDLAGNNIGKTFDVDPATGASPRMSKEKVSVHFEVK